MFITLREPTLPRHIFIALCFPISLALHFVVRRVRFACSCCFQLRTSSFALKKLSIIDHMHWFQIATFFQNCSPFLVFVYCLSSLSLLPTCDGEPLIVVSFSSDIVFQQSTPRSGHNCACLRSYAVRAECTFYIVLTMRFLF